MQLIYFAGCFDHITWSETCAWVVEGNKNVFLPEMQLFSVLNITMTEIEVQEEGKKCANYFKYKPEKKVFQ